MTLTSLKNIKNLLKKYQIRPSKGLGQNFLVDKEAVKKIIEAADLEIEDIVLEVGPGLGVLTQELAKKVKKVIGIEKDWKMVEILKETLKDRKNVEIVLGDILKIGNWKLIENWKLEIGNYKVVANLPFYLTAPVIRQFLEYMEVQPQYMVLMVQKEVAQRICAKPRTRTSSVRGRPPMNLLAISVQFYAEPEIVSYISKKSFWPQPKVDSAIIKITPLPNKILQRSDLCQSFFKIVRAGFSQPRKQLINNLSKGLNLGKEKIQNWLLKNHIQPSQRAETLSVDDWLKLTKSFKIE